MNKLESFNRGRNDRRDNRDVKHIMQAGLLDSSYHAGHEYQEGIIKNGKYNAAFEDGKNAAKNGNAKENNPHPQNSKVWSSWNNGWETHHLLY